MLLIVILQVFNTGLMDVTALGKPILTQKNISTQLQWLQVVTLCILSLTWPLKCIR